MDESGLPETAAQRVAIAERIVAEAETYGLDREDIVIDCLTLTISARQEQAMETLRAVRGGAAPGTALCTRGQSNISFGLPARAHDGELPHSGDARWSGFSDHQFEHEGGHGRCCLLPRVAVRMRTVPPILSGLLPSRQEIRRRKELGITDAAADVKSDTPTAEGCGNRSADGLSCAVSAMMQSRLRVGKSEHGSMDIIQNKVVPALDIVGDRMKEIMLPATADQCGKCSDGGA